MDTPDTLDALLKLADELEDDAAALEREGVAFRREIEPPLAALRELAGLPPRPLSELLGEEVESIRADTAGNRDSATRS